MVDMGAVKQSFPEYGIVCAAYGEGEGRGTDCAAQPRDQSCGPKSGSTPRTARHPYVFSSIDRWDGPYFTVCILPIHNHNTQFNAAIVMTEAHNENAYFRCH